MVSQSIEIKATPKKCYDVITDFKNYPKFLSNVSGVDVESEKKNVFEVTYTISVVKNISYTLKMKGTPGKKLEWTLIEGDFMKQNEGSWQLKEIKKGVTEATYNIDIKFGLLVPGSVTKRLVGSSLPTMLKEFKKRIEK